MMKLHNRLLGKSLAVALPAIAASVLLQASYGMAEGFSTTHITDKSSEIALDEADSVFRLPVLVAQSKISEEKVSSKKKSKRKRKRKKVKLTPNEIDPLAPLEGDLKETTALGKDEKEALKKKYPCNPIYLSGRGVCAGTGDPDKVAGAALKMGMGAHPLALELSELPKDQYGLVDWAEALRSKAIQPWASLRSKRKKRYKKPMDLDIPIKAKSKFIHDVMFPHRIHTMWLNCSSCHPKIFKRQQGGNPEMTMPKIASGEYCGRCHNRIAFPLSDCLRCHTKPKGSTCSTRDACMQEAGLAK